MAGFSDPVKKLEEELEELERLQRADLGIEGDPEKGEKGNEGDEGGDAGKKGTEGRTDDQGEGDASTADGGQDGKKTEGQGDDGSGKGDQAGATDAKAEGVWEQRYRTLQGMFKADIAREVERATTELTAENQRLQRELAQAKKAQPAGGDDSGEGDGDDEYTSPHVTDELRASEAYRRMAAQYGTGYAETQFEASVLTAQSQVKPVSDKVENRDATAGYHTQINDLFPGWEKVNTDPRFIEWCKIQVPYTGKSRLQLLNDAYQGGDAAGVAQFFIDYSDEVNTRQHSTDDRSGKQQGRDASAYVAPDRSGSTDSASIEANKGQAWKRGDWNEAWKRIELGKVTGKDAQALEAELINAETQGRVVG